jgi:serine/threonine protein kinase
MPPSGLTNEDIIHAFPSLSRLQFLGSGGFKSVYLATIQGRQEVFKLINLPLEGTDDESRAYRREALARVKREIQILGECQAKEIVKLGTLTPTQAHIGQEDYMGYSEEYLPGEDLGKIIDAKGIKPTEAECKLLFKTLLVAIRTLWAKKYVHRDIKPQNVVKLNQADRPFVLLDLGIAFGIFDTALTFNPANRLPPATYRYLAPEMTNIDFRQNLNYRSDLYSSALTVFEFAAQEHPLARSRDDLIQTISRAIRQAPRPMKERRPDFSEDFCASVDQMLKKSPSLRPANLDALISLMT